MTACILNKRPEAEIYKQLLKQASEKPLNNSSSILFGTAQKEILFKHISNSNITRQMNIPISNNTIGNMSCG